MAHVYWNERLIVEGAGATPIAALLGLERAKFGERVAVLITGSSVDGSVLLDIVRRYRGEVVLS